VINPFPAPAEQTTDPLAPPSGPYQRVILFALNNIGSTKHIYGGTVPFAEIQRRRKRNKASRAANVARLRAAR
jgi:hypothetical protein